MYRILFLFPFEVLYFSDLEVLGILIFSELAILVCFKTWCFKHAIILVCKYFEVIFIVFILLSQYDLLSQTSCTLIIYNILLVEYFTPHKGCVT